MSVTGAATRVGMAPRAAGLTFETAQEHWRTEHRDVALGIPGLIGYVQNHAVLSDGVPLLPYPGFDMCAETEFADFETMRRGFASEHYRQTVRNDEQNLIDGNRFMLALTRRQVLVDGAPAEDAVKLITLLRTHPASTRERMIETLLGPYVEAASEARPQRHELLITQPEEHEPGLPPCCDAIDLLWFSSPDEALEALRAVLSDRAGWLLAGIAFGTERLLAKPIRQR